MKWLNGYGIKFMLCTVIAVIVLSAANALAEGLVDDFNRPDGEVANGWSIWRGGNLDIKIVDNEVLISGQQRGDWHRSGIYRPVDGETRFSFDFKADDNLCVHIELADAETLDTYSTLVEVYAWPGGPFSYVSRYPGDVWPGWTQIPGSPRITGGYYTLMVEQEGTEFTVALNGQVLGTFTNDYFTRVGEVFISADAAAGTVGSLHIDNFKMEIPEDDKPTPEEGTRAPLFTFGEPVNLGPSINTEAHECFSTISSDGLELYFFDLYLVRSGNIGGMDIWMIRRASVSEAWGEPVNLGPPINTEYDDAKPSLSADGLTLYFSSNRPGGHGEFDIWMSTRATVMDPWGEPVNLGEPVNSEFELYLNEWEVFRPEGYGEGDIWVAKRASTDDPWGDPVNLGEAVNSIHYDSCPYLSPDGLLLFFHGWRPGGPGQEDMWVSTRSSTSDAWDSPIPLPAPINGRQIEGCPGVSADGSTFYFASLRGGGSGMGDTWQAPIMPVVDFNGDGSVDNRDLEILNSYIGMDESLCDIGPMPWGDGIVDEIDLEVLMDYMGQEVHYPTKLASLPKPFDQGLSDVEQARFLSWWPGSGASEHDVYVGTNSVAVENADASDTTGVYRGRQQAGEYTLPEDVLAGQNFYWRVDEVSVEGIITKGELWSFSVTDYLIVDDMESSEPAWERWWDGWGDPNNGSEVWFPESNIVHGGEQSLYLLYDNSTAPISYLLRVWETPQDWTRKGAETLVLCLHGDPDNTTEPFQITLGDSADNVEVIAHPDPAVLLSDTWQQWSVPLADLPGVQISLM
jgi:hypothetical protein